MKCNSNSLVFSCSKDTKRYYKSFAKASKGVFTIPIPFKANASLYSNTFQYSGAINACNNFAFPINGEAKTL